MVNEDNNRLLKNYNSLIAIQLTSLEFSTEPTQLLNLKLRNYAYIFISDICIYL